MQLKMKKKGNVGSSIMMVFGGIAVGLLIFGVTMVLFNVFISQARAISTVSADGNATAALNSIQTTGNTLVNWTQLAILIAVFGALIAGLVFGGIWAYGKTKGGM